MLEKKIHGLFLSTSSLTPEAQDYYRSIKNYGVNCYTGKDLFERIIESLCLPNISLLDQKLIELKYNPLVNFILTTDYGYFRVIIASTNESVTPSHFVVYNHNAELITDSSFLRNIRINIKELTSLEPISGKVDANINTEHRIIQEGLLLGKDWTDYRLPAGPQFYYGKY